MVIHCYKKQLKTLVSQQVTVSYIVTSNITKITGIKFDRDSKYLANFEA